MIIAVHQIDRPIDRAVRSVLSAAKPGQARVLVVCHGLPKSEVKAKLGEELAKQVTLLEHVDGIPSAAGPFNAGLTAAEAEFVSIMGSDDYLLAGSLSSWIEQATSQQLDAVLAPIVMQSGAQIRTPRLRPLRHKTLDPVRDRLAYRTAPLGLLRLAALRTPKLRFGEGFRTGEDIGLALKLWFGGTRIAMASTDTSYLVGEDAVERVTSVRLPLADEFAPLFQLLDDPWFDGLSASRRRSIAVKFARIHLLPALLVRGIEHDWAGDDGQTARRLLSLLENRAAGFDHPFSRADLKLLSGVRDSATLPIGIQQSIRRHLDSSWTERLIAGKLLGNLNRESNLRYYLDLKLVALLNRLTPNLVS